MDPVPFDQLLSDHFAAAPKGEQARWARTLGISEASLSRYRRGQQIPDRRDAPRFAPLLHLPPADVAAAIDRANDIRLGRIAPPAAEHTHPELVAQLDEMFSLLRRLAEESGRGEELAADVERGDRHLDRLDETVRAAARRRRRGSGSSGGGSR